MGRRQLRAAGMERFTIPFATAWFGSENNQVWALSLTGTPTWSSIVPLGTPPPPRVGHLAVYDPVRDRMLVFGGERSPAPQTIVALNDVWELTLGGTPTWTQLLPSGAPPSPRWLVAGAYDSGADRLLVFGGYS